jgi:hypothetical protein
MKKQIRAFRVSLVDVLNGHPADALNQKFVAPVKATLLAFKAGTLIQDEAGNYYSVTMGEWHREGNSALPQVDAFDQLNAVGLTVLKTDLLKEIVFSKENTGGQEDGKHNSGNDAKIEPPVEASPKRQKKSKDRTGAV